MRQAVYRGFMKIVHSITAVFGALAAAYLAQLLIALRVCGNGVAATPE
jgi:hypothetical protein